MEYLNLDLNEVVSEEVKKEIDSRDISIKNLRDRIREIEDKNEVIEKQLINIKNLNALFENIKQNYTSITATKSSDKHRFRSVVENKYEFIKNLMFFVYGIKDAYRFYEGPLIRNLAINYYNYKEELTSLLLLLEENNINAIKKFRMPIDFTKKEILDYVKNPHSCTNGSDYGVNRFYIESDGNIPHDLYQQNKYILEDDVFEEVLKTMKEKRGMYHFLYTIPKYNDLPEAKIARIGETFIKKFSGLRVKEKSIEICLRGCEE